MIVNLQANALLLMHGAARVALLTHQTAVLAHPSNSYDWCPWYKIRWKKLVIHTNHNCESTHAQTQ